MKSRILFSVAITGLLVGHAFADTPAFLAGKKLYASDWKACVGFQDGGAPDDSYTLDKDSISGYEFSCQFVDMKLVPDWTGQGRQNNYIGTASCSDDSGINRPDLFDLSFYENTITVTSQNDYVYDAIRAPKNPDQQSLGFINKQFELCQPE